MGLLGAGRRTYGEGAGDVGVLGVPSPGTGRMAGLGRGIPAGVGGGKLRIGRFQPLVVGAGGAGGGVGWLLRQTLGWEWPGPAPGEGFTGEPTARASPGLPRQVAGPAGAAGDPPG
jgi:hypothetical protein